MLHRDIKPSNIIFGASGYLMVTDFGLAGRPGSSGRRWLTGKPKDLKMSDADRAVLKGMGLGLEDAAAPQRRKAPAVVEFMTLRHHLGWTALHTACAMGRPPAVKVLIDMKADVNREDDAGRRPLHLAAAADRLGVIELLRPDKLITRYILAPRAVSPLPPEPMAFHPRAIGQRSRPCRDRRARSR